MRPKAILHQNVFLLVTLFVPTVFGAEPSGSLGGPFASEESYLAEVRAHSTLLDDRQAVGLVRNVELRVSDQVGDGCWTSADALQSRVRVEFERSGIPVYEEKLAFRDQFSPGLEVVVVGYRIQGGGPCVANASIEEIASVEGVSLTLAEQIYRQLH